MADPTKYERDYSFSDYQANNPNKPLPAAQVDTELDNVANALDTAVDAIKDIRRSDGALKNGIVTISSLATGVLTPQSGTTAQRPTTGLVTGMTYFDTTLGTPIWRSGLVWVSATGATV